MDATHQLAELVVSTDYSDVPSRTAEAAKRCLRDHLGVALLGSRSESGRRIREYVATAHPGDAATIAGGGTATPGGAALANGTFAHVDDYDDTYDSIVIHPSTPVVPAALAAAEVEGASGPDLLTAHVVGTEVLYQVGHSVYPEHYDNGWHITGTVGTFGAAAAAASIADLPIDEVKHAFGIAASGAPTALKKNMGSTIKLTHPGQAAQRGLEAAILARDGWTADRSVFDGTKGYCSAMTPGREIETPEIGTDLGEKWSLSDVGFKLYPSAIVTHAAIHAFESFLAEEGLEGADVESVEVVVDDSIDVLEHPELAGPFEAKFSFEFCLGLVASEGSVRPQYFSEAYLSDDALRRQMAKVAVETESSLFGEDYFGYGARLRVRTADGDEYVREQRHPPGMPAEPADEERLREKFRECAAVAVDESATDRIDRNLRTLEEDGSLEAVLDAIAASSTE